jgi:hypothetical protein
MKSAKDGLRRCLASADVRAVAALMLLCGGVASVYLFGVTGSILAGYGPEAEWFTPAILWISGHGLITPQPGGIPGLQEFMRGAVDHFDIAQLPEQPATWDLSSFCQTHRYLLYAVGIAWSLFGVSWTTVKLVPLAAYLASTLLLYGLFRLVSGRKTACFGAALVMLSPPVLAMLPSVRDFCKMPFFLAIFLLLGILIKHPLSTRRYLALAAGLGALCGIGIGFRQDFLACVAPCVAGVLLLAPFDGAVPLKHRMLAALAVLAALVITGWPVLGAIQRENGAVSSHSLAQGLSSEAEARLGIGGASYELLETTNDNLVHANIYTFDRRAGHSEVMENYLSPAYGDAGRRFFRAVALTFPYDLSLRAFAAVNASFRILSNAPRDLAQSPIFQNSMMSIVSRIYAIPAALVSAVGLCCAIAVFFVLLSLRPHAGLAWLALFLYFTGYTSVLFQYRHAFHLAFVGPLFVAAAFTGLHQRATLWPALRAPGRLRRGLLLGGACIAAMLVALGGLRGVQGLRVHALLPMYQQAKLAQLETTSEAAGGMLHLRPSMDVTGGASRPPAGLMDVSSAYVALQWKTLPAGARVEVVYDTRSVGCDFSRTIIPPDVLEGYTGPATLFIPIYESSAAKPYDGSQPLYANVEFERARFAGVRIRQEDAPQLEGFQFVEHPESFPFFLTLWLSPDASHMRLRKGWLASP